MLKKVVATGPLGKVIVMDSITKVTPEDAASYVVSASHGGASSGEFALEVPLKLALFNDAGVGKDDAGIAALAMLQAQQLSTRAMAIIDALGLVLVVVPLSVILIDLSWLIRGVTCCS